MGQSSKLMLGRKMDMSNELCVHNSELSTQWLRAQKLLGMGAHTCDPGNREAEGRIAGSGPAWVI